MAWQPTLPPDPVAAGWWHRPVERAEAEQRAADVDRALVVPALAARVGRAIRDIDRVLAEAGPCDCVAAGYRAGCVACRGLDAGRPLGSK